MSSPSDLVPYFLNLHCTVTLTTSLIVVPITFVALHIYWPLFDLSMLVIIKTELALLKFGPVQIKLHTGQQVEAWQVIVFNVCPFFITYDVLSGDNTATDGSTIVKQ